LNGSPPHSLFPLCSDLPGGIKNEGHCGGSLTAMSFFFQALSPPPGGPFPLPRSPLLGTVELPPIDNVTLLCFKTCTWGSRLPVQAMPSSFFFRLSPTDVRCVPMIDYETPINVSNRRWATQIPLFYPPHFFSPPPCFFRGCHLL